jgi:hypothetical protein
MLKRFLVTTIRRSLPVVLLICTGSVAQSAPPDLARKIEQHVRARFSIPAYVKAEVGAIVPSGDLPGYDAVTVTFDFDPKWTLPPNTPRDWRFPSHNDFLISKDRNTMLRVTRFELTKGPQTTEANPSASPDLASKIEQGVRGFYSIPDRIKVTVGTSTPSGDLPGYDAVTATVGFDPKPKVYDFLLRSEHHAAGDPAGTDEGASTRRQSLRGNL